MAVDATLLGRYDAADLGERFRAAGVWEALAARGFEAPEVTIDGERHALPSVLVFARRSGQRYLLIEASLGETVVAPEFFAARGSPVARPLSFVLVYWLREQDPSRCAPAARPLLPLQHHPGLGVLRRAFRVVVSLTADLGRDGVASVPKLFHDAALFFHSRLFLFLDGAEQGRFEALLRDLAPLPLGEASLALVAGCVRGRSGEVERWAPGVQVFPLSAEAAAYFHSPAYADAVARALEESSFACDGDALACARETLQTTAIPGLFAKTFES